MEMFFLPQEMIISKTLVIIFVPTISKVPQKKKTLFLLEMISCKFLIL